MNALTYLIATEKSGLGEITSDQGSFQVEAGRSITVHFIPANGWRLLEVLVDNVSQGKIDQYTFSSIAADHFVTARFEPDYGQMKWLSVNVSGNGEASVVGTHWVMSGTRFPLTFTPQKGNIVQEVRVNGVSVGAPKTYDLVVNENTDVAVYFAPAQTFEIATSHNGHGQVIVAELAPFYQGEAVHIDLIPDLGYQVGQITLDGQVIENRVRVTLEDLNQNHTLSVEFVSFTPHAQLEVYFKDPRDKWTRPIIEIRNNSAEAIQAGWYFDYYFTLSQNQYPNLQSFWVPDAQMSLVAIDKENYHVRIVVNKDLNPGQSYQSQFGMHLDSWQHWYTSNDWSNNGNLGPDWVLNDKIPVYDAQGHLLTGLLPNLSQVEVLQPTLKVEIKDDHCNDDQWINLRLKITNVGDIPISDFTAVYTLHVAEGFYPQIFSWYVPVGKVSLVPIGAKDYQIVFDFAGYTLNPGQILPNGNIIDPENGDGINLGIALNGYVPMNKNDDPSYHDIVGLCGQWRETHLITVTDKNGETVDPTQEVDPVEENGESPVIKVHPIDQCPKFIGEYAEFAVESFAGGDIRYEWFVNNKLQKGLMGPVFRYGPLQGENHLDEIFARLSFAGKTQKTTSQSAKVCVVEKPSDPVFSAELPDLIFKEGATAHYQVDVADFGATLTYAWYVNNELYSTTGAAIDIGPLTFAQNNTLIYVVVSNGYTSIKSNVAVLKVLENKSSSESLILEFELNNGNGQLVGVNDPVRVSATIELYDASQEGQLKYTERFWVKNANGLLIKDGRLMVPLGTGWSDENLAEVLRANDNLYAQLYLGNPVRQEKIEERLPLSAVPYALSNPTQDKKYLEGNGDPNVLKIMASPGQIYVDQNTQKTYQKTPANWRELQ